MSSSPSSCSVGDRSVRRRVGTIALHGGNWVGLRLNRELRRGVDRTWSSGSSGRWRSGCADARTGVRRAPRRRRCTSRSRRSAARPTRDHRSGRQVELCRRRRCVGLRCWTVRGRWDVFWSRRQITFDVGRWSPLKCDGPRRISPVCGGVKACPRARSDLSVTIGSTRCRCAASRWSNPCQRSLAPRGDPGAESACRRGSWRSRRTSDSPPGPS
jgi:hypothetical protein